jgi:type IV secretory pathway TrbL component
MSTKPLPPIDLQEVIVPYLTGALTTLQPFVDSLTYFFAVVAIVSISIRYITATDETQIQTLKWLVPTLFTMVGLVWLTSNLNEFASVIHGSLTKMGFLAAGVDEKNIAVNNPQQIFKLSIDVYMKLVGSCGTFSWYNPLLTLCAALAGFLIVISGLVLFLYVLVKTYHFKALVLAGCVMIPPGLWIRTATIAEDWITKVVNAGISMFMVVVFASLPLPVFEKLKVDYNLECHPSGFLWLGGGFVVWTVITVTMSHSFSNMVSKAITLYGSK